MVEVAVGGHRLRGGLRWEKTIRGTTTPAAAVAGRGRHKTSVAHRRSGTGEVAMGGRDDYDGRCVVGAQSREDLAVAE